MRTIILRGITPYQVLSRFFIESEREGRGDIGGERT